MTPFKCYRDFIKRIGIKKNNAESININSKPKKKKQDSKQNLPISLMKISVKKSMD